MATGARRRGLKVVAVTSVEQSRAGRPPLTRPRRLLDHADIVLDLCTPVGDALVAIDGLDTPVGAGLDDRRRRARQRDQGPDGRELLVERGAMLPVLTSAALVGQEASARLFEPAYAEYARRCRGSSGRCSGGGRKERSRT